MTQEITYFDLISFFNFVTGYLNEQKEQTKLTANMKRFCKHNTRLIDEYNEKVNNILLDNCAVDPKTKVILKDDRGELCFTVEGQKKCNKERQELIDSVPSKPISLFITKWDELTEAEIEIINGLPGVFNGFVWLQEEEDNSQDNNP